MLAIRDELQQSRRTSSDSLLDHTSLGPSPPTNVRYISSLYLAQSSLSSDVSQYDFSYSISHIPSANRRAPIGMDENKVLNGSM